MENKINNIQQLLEHKKEVEIKLRKIFDFYEGLNRQDKMAVNSLLADKLNIKRDLIHFWKSKTIPAKYHKIVFEIFNFKYDE